MLFDVIILDTGIESSHPALSQYSDVRCEYLHRGTGQSVPDDVDIFGHGTAVAGIIKENQPQASVLCLRIFDLVDGKPSSGEGRLIEALRFIDETYDVKVINLSCNVVQLTRMAELIAITKKLTEKGVVLVSAFENNGALTYPAAFEWVIGVATDHFRTAGAGLESVDDDIINIVDSVRRVRVPWLKGKYEMKSGSSFSCALISSYSLAYLEKGAHDFHEVLDCFKRDYPPKKRSRRNNGPHMPNFTIQKAAIFPCNKEVHSVIRYAQDLTFELVDIYDIKQSFRLGRSTREILDDENVPEYLVKNIKNIDWSSFDTLILGCVFELSMLLNGVSWLKELLDEALLHKKNIYAFEEISGLINVEKNKDTVFFPAVFQENIPPYRGGRFFRTAVPIIGVYGTRSQQGKFTLQMLLRKEFQKINCKVGQIGTEPNALLFGMDYVFPMGHKGSIYTDENGKMLYVNDLLRRVCNQDPDIIIVGSQMGTVPNGFGNIMSYCTQTYAFLQGVKPDYAVVMLSLTDDCEYIQRTVDFLYSITKTRTLAFVLFPMCDISLEGEFISQNRRITQNEYSKFKEMIEEEFNLPVFLLGSTTLAENLMKTLLVELEKEM